MKLLVDGVFFQIGRSGIARVWTHLFQTWIDQGRGDDFVVIDRGHTLPRLPGLRCIDAPAFVHGPEGHDEAIVQGLCHAVGATAFVSTYYTRPQSGGTPTLMMVHDMIPEVLGWDLSEPMWRRKADCIAHAHAFACVSHHTARDLRERLPAGDRRPITVTPNGCDFQPASADAVQAFAQRHGLTRPWFMLSGTRSDYKNAALFFDAFEQLGDERAQFDLVCTGGGALEPRFLEQAGPAGTHVAIFSDADMVCAYSGATALVYPSTYEGFGLPVLEAMACGCPVIATAVASLAEVGGQATLRIDLGEGAAGQLARHLRTVQQPAVRADLRTAGLAQARGFRWDTMADGLRQAVESLPPPPPAIAPVQPSHPTGTAPMTLLRPDDLTVQFPGVTGPLSAVLPAGHLLPHYQQQHRLYDRFLPVLAQCLPPGSTVIDVGANCGDTLAGMAARNTALNWLCIEPDAGFYRYLQHNADALQAQHPATHIHLKQALVGQAVASAVLDGTGGSKHARSLDDPSQALPEGTEVHHAIKLDDLVAGTAGLSVSGITLLKSDVDGFDHDVLNSASQVLDHSRPLLFFECQATDAAQRSAYAQCIEGLGRFGYRHFWLFDNYGNPMFEAGSAEAVIQVFDYIWRQGRQGATRSMYYVDILATHDGNRALAHQAVGQFLATLAP